VFAIGACLFSVECAMTVSGLAEFCDVFTVLEFATGFGPALSQAASVSAAESKMTYFI
jgi:hypothetical protein